MKTLELVKSRIASIDRKVNSYKEIEAACPRMKQVHTEDGRFVWALQNPETLKWVEISEAEVDELSNLYHIAKYGISIDDDPFMFH